MTLARKDQGGYPDSARLGIEDMEAEKDVSLPAYAGYMAIAAAFKVGDVVVAIKNKLVNTEK